MEALGLIGIAVAIFIIIFMAMKGFNIIFVAPIAAIIVILTNGMEFFPSLIGSENSYMTGMTNFMVQNFAVFLLGAILAKYMEKSGAAQSIAQKILQFTGTDRPFPVLVAVFLISSVLTFGGISVFVVLFVIIPMAKPLFKELNIAWNLITIPVILGMSTYTMTMLPGTPSIQNVIPSNALGTSLTAAPIVGIVASIVAVGTGFIYMYMTLKKSQRKKETFADFSTSDSVDEMKQDIPSFAVSVLPIVLLIAIILAGSAANIPNIILIALTTAIVVSIIIFHKYLPSQKTTLNEGAVNSISPVFLTSSAVAFGIVVTSAPSFTVISNFILEIPGSPLISLSFVTAVLSAITGSSSGALGIVMESFAGSYMEMGVQPELLHRISAIASGVLTNMPHSGVVLTFFALTGLTHKNGFKYTFVTCAVMGFFGLVAAIVTGMILY